MKMGRFFGPKVIVLPRRFLVSVVDKGLAEGLANRSGQAVGVVQAGTCGLYEGKKKSTVENSKSMRRKADASAA
jgi:hypothetical protein